MPADYAGRDAAAGAMGIRGLERPRRRARALPFLPDTRAALRVLGQPVADAAKAAAFRPRAGRNSARRSTRDRPGRRDASRIRARARLSADAVRRGGDFPGDRPVLHLRLGAAPVGLAGHRRLPRPGAGAGARRAVQHHRRTVGIRLFRGRLLRSLRRARVDSAHRRR